MQQAERRGAAGPPLRRAPMASDWSPITSRVALVTVRVFYTASAPGPPDLSTLSDDIQAAVMAAVRAMGACPSETDVAVAAPPYDHRPTGLRHEYTSTVVLGVTKGTGVERLLLAASQDGASLRVLGGAMGTWRVSRIRVEPGAGGITRCLVRGLPANFFVDLEASGQLLQGELRTFHPGVSVLDLQPLRQGSAGLAGRTGVVTLQLPPSPHGGGASRRRFMLNSLDCQVFQPGGPELCLRFMPLPAGLTDPATPGTAPGAGGGGPSYAPRYQPPGGQPARPPPPPPPVGPQIAHCRQRLEETRATMVQQEQQLALLLQAQAALAARGSARPHMAVPSAGPSGTSSGPPASSPLPPPPPAASSPGPSPAGTSPTGTSPPAPSPPAASPPAPSHPAPSPSAAPAVAVPVVVAPPAPANSGAAGPSVGMPPPAVPPPAASGAVASGAGTRSASRAPDAPPAPSAPPAPVPSPAPPATAGSSGAAPGGAAPRPEPRRRSSSGASAGSDGAEASDPCMALVLSDQALVDVFGEGALRDRDLPMHSPAVPRRRGAKTARLEDGASVVLALEAPPLSHA